MSRNRAKAFAVTGIVGALVLTACSGANTSGGTAAPGKSSGGGELNVLMVGNPQMKDLEKLAPANFTKKTGIKVNFTILPENELRDRVCLLYTSDAADE